jgi:hypothetical protein
MGAPLNPECAVASYCDLKILAVPIYRDFPILFLDIFMNMPASQNLSNCAVRYGFLRLAIPPWRDTFWVKYVLWHYVNKVIYLLKIRVNNNENCGEKE